VQDALAAKRIACLEACKVSNIVPKEYDPDKEHLHHVTTHRGGEGLPAEFFFPGFGAFLSNWQSRSEVPVELEEEDRITARALIFNVFGEYGSKHEFTLAINKALNEYFSGLTFTSLVVKNFAVDACLVTRNVEFPILLRIDELEAGVGSYDPVDEAAAYYMHVVGERMREASCSNMPCLLMTISGHMITLAFACVATKIRVDSVVGHEILESANHVNDLARFLKCLKICVNDLHTYYQQFEVLPSYSSALHRRLCFPYFSGWDDKHNLVYKQQLSEFLLLAELRDNSQDFTFVKNVIVKFCESYCVEAHRCLGEYAPELLWAGPLPGRWTVVVMEYVPNCRQWSNECTTQQIQSLTQAVQCLHEHNFVHGMLVPENILVQRGSGRVYIIGFQWAGREGAVRYPEELILSDFDLFEEVGSLISRQHDDVMLDKVIHRGMQKDKVE
jgi:serine/threonine protein kinase